MLLDVGQAMCIYITNIPAQAVESALERDSERERELENRASHYLWDVVLVAVAALLPG